MAARAEKITSSAARLAQNREWLLAEREHEMLRLQAVLRDPRRTAEDVRIATEQLKFWGSNE
jgi:hypothetical protein